MNFAEAKSSRVGVIYKNQLHPRIGELEARAAKTDDKGEANAMRISYLNSKAGGFRGTTRPFRTLIKVL